MTTALKICFPRHHKSFQLQCLIFTSCSKHPERRFFAETLSGCLSSGALLGFPIDGQASVAYSATPLNLYRSALVLRAFFCHTDTMLTACKQQNGHLVLFGNRL
eukprot:585429-Amphidinium_carterae.1